MFGLFLLGVLQQHVRGEYLCYVKTLPGGGVELMSFGLIPCKKACY